MAITVVTMGVHYRWDIPEQVRAQLLLAHQLREELIALQHEYERAVARIWSSYPRVAAAEVARENAEEELVAAGVAARTTRTQRLDGTTRRRLVAAQRAAVAARAARRHAIAHVKDHARQQIRAASDELRAKQRALYAGYCQSGDLYWATFNDVLAQHRATVKRIQAQRKAGKPAQLRSHRFDGGGTISVQLQRVSGMPERTPAMVAADDSKYRNVLQVPWIAPATWNAMSRADQRRAGRVTARIRCGSRDGEPCWVEIPVQQHQMLPEYADITGAQLTIRRVAGHHKATLALTARVPEPDTGTADGPTVAMHLGWLATEHGIVTATWRASEPLTVPAEFQHVMAADREGLTGTVVLPTTVIDRLHRGDGQRAHRDRALAEIRAAVTGWLGDHGPVTHPTRDGEKLDADAVAEWRSAARFAALALAWRANPPAGGEWLADQLEQWRRADRRLWEAQEHGRGRALRARNDIYRNIAAMLSRQAARIVVADTNLADIARARSTLPGQARASVARRRVIAAPAILRSAVLAAAAREGVAVTTVSAKHLSRLHARCGHLNPADDRYLTRPVICDGCGARYDQDASATVLMLARADIEIG